MSAKPNIPRPCRSFPFSAPTLAHCFTSITLSREHRFLIAVQHGLHAFLHILRMAALLGFCQALARRSQPVMLNLSMPADSMLMRFLLPVPPLACSVPFATVYIVILAASPHFFFAKVAKHVLCKYHSSFIIHALFSKSFGTSLKTFAMPIR